MTELIFVLFFKYIFGNWNYRNFFLVKFSKYLFKLWTEFKPSTVQNILNSNECLMKPYYSGKTNYKLIFFQLYRFGAMLKECDTLIYYTLTFVTQIDKFNIRSIYFDINRFTLMANAHFCPDAKFKGNFRATNIAFSIMIRLVAIELIYYQNNAWMEWIGNYFAYYYSRKPSINNHMNDKSQR